MERGGSVLNVCVGVTEWIGLMLQFIALQEFNVAAEPSA